LSFLQLAFGEFGLLELCRLTLFKFRIKVLKTQTKPNSPPSWAIDPYSRPGRIPPTLLPRCTALKGTECHHHPLFPPPHCLHSNQERTTPPFSLSGDLRSEPVAGPPFPTPKSKSRSLRSTLTVSS
jgi:hypothetical protein